MKQSILVWLLCSTFAFNGYCQTEKGNFLLGGSLSLYQQQNASSDMNAFSISPNIGYLFANRAVIGWHLTYYYQRVAGMTPPLTNVVRHDHVFTPVVFGRYYFLKTTNKWQVFGQAGIGLSYANVINKFNNGQTFTNSESEGIGELGVGVSYFLNRYVALELLTKYNLNDKTLTFADHNYSKGLQFRFGVQVYLNRQKTE